MRTYEDQVTNMSKQQSFVEGPASSIIVSFTSFHRSSKGSSVSLALSIFRKAPIQKGAPKPLSRVKKHCQGVLEPLRAREVLEPASNVSGLSFFLELRITAIPGDRPNRDF